MVFISGPALRRWMDERGLSHRALAMRAGVPATVINRALQSESSSIKPMHLKKIANGLDVGLRELAGKGPEISQEEARAALMQLVEPIEP